MIHWFTAAWLCAVLVFCGSSAAAVLLSDVRVRGNLRVESGLILQQVNSRAGEPYAVDTVRDDIRAIYQLGYFEDIEVELEEGGVLTFLVLERPALLDWRAEGVDELETEDVNAAVPLKRREILDQARVVEGERAIRQLFRDKGYFLARVSHEVLPVDDGKNQVEVIYRAEHGEKVRIKNVNLIGVRNVSEGKLRGVMATGEAGEWSWITGSGKFKEADLERDREVMRAFYLNQGYIDVEVLEPLVTLTKDREWIKIDIPVREGRQYRVGKVSFSGDLEYPEETLRGSAGMFPGKVFSSDDYRAAVDSLTDLYGDIGYAFVEINPRTQRHEEELLLDLDFRIVKGEPVHIGRIEIRGNDKTRDRVIRREMRLDEGELYNRRLLKRSQAKINSLDFFETVNVNNHRRPGTDLLDIDIDVVEKATGSFSVGAGYSSADGIIGMLNVSPAQLPGPGLPGVGGGQLRHQPGDLLVWLQQPPGVRFQRLRRIRRVQELPGVQRLRQGFAGVCPQAGDRPGGGLAHPLGLPLGTSRCEEHRCGCTGFGVGSRGDQYHLFDHPDPHLRHPGQPLGRVGGQQTGSQRRVGRGGAPGGQ